MDRLSQTREVARPVVYTVHGFFKTPLAKNLLQTSATNIIRRTNTTNTSKKLESLVKYLSRTLIDPNKPLTFQNIKRPRKYHLRKIEELAKEIDSSLKLTLVSGEYKLTVSNKPNQVPVTAITAPPPPIQTISESEPTTPISAKNEPWLLRRFICKHKLFTKPDDPGSLLDDLYRGFLLDSDRDGFFRNIIWQVTSDYSVSLLIAFVNRLLLCDLKEIRSALQERQDDALLFSKISSAFIFSSEEKLPDLPHPNYPKYLWSKKQKLEHIKDIFEKIKADHLTLLE